jgi:hypothetical protein
MSTTLISGTMLHVEASADVGAPAPDVYRMIADYHNGHPRILPPRYFRNLQVDEGGYGDGTVIRFDMIVYGKTIHARGRVTGPEPGRVLVETYPDMGVVTSFVVEPLGASTSRVTIATDMPTRAGVLGRIERAVTRSFLKRAYAAELAQLGVEAVERPVGADRAGLNRK